MKYKKGYPIHVYKNKKTLCGSNIDLVDSFVKIGFEFIVINKHLCKKCLKVRG